MDKVLLRVAVVFSVKKTKPNWSYSVLVHEGLKRPQRQCSHCGKSPDPCHAYRRSDQQLASQAVFWGCIPQQRQAGSESWAIFPHPPNWNRQLENPWRISAQAEKHSATLRCDASALWVSCQWRQPGTAGCALRAGFAAPGQTAAPLQGCTSLGTPPVRLLGCRRWRARLWKSCQALVHLHFNAASGNLQVFLGC